MISTRSKRLIEPVSAGTVIQATGVDAFNPFHRQFRRIDARDLPPDYVLTPGGPHHRSLVQPIQSGQIIDMTKGDWQLLDHTRALVRRFEAIELNPAVPAFGTGWIAFAAANLSPTPLSFLSTTWTVPPPPRSSDNQLLYLFNGFQVVVNSTDPNKAGTHILQPVLQWGISPDGGGPQWAVASWFAGNQNQPAQYTNPLINVNPGDTLTGTITLTSNVGGVLTYECQFQGYPGTKLTVQLNSVPYMIAETLEVYGVQQGADFPNTYVTPLRNIVVNVGSVSPSLAWGVTNSATDSGQYATVASGANPNGEIDIFYGYTLDLTNKVILGDTSSDSPSLASQNGMLFLAWKGSGNDNLNVMLSANNGQAFGNKLTSPETTDTAPSIAGHNGEVIIAWKGSGNSNMNIAQVPLVQNNSGTYDIQQFANKTILGDTTDTPPAIASHNGLLFLAWKGSGNDNLNVMVSADNGHSWTGKVTSPETSSNAPTLVSHNGKLFIAWRGSGNDNLNVAQVPYSFQGNQWVVQQFQQKIILGDTSSAAPALTSYAGQLVISWRGSGNNNLNVMLSPDDGQTFVGKCIYGEFTDIAPTLTTHNGLLCLGWKGSGNDNMNVAQVALDGDLTLLPWEEDLTGASGSIAVAHQAMGNQLDVIAVNQNGALSVAWVTGEQQWSGPAPLTVNGFAPAAAPVALAHQTSFHQLDALVVNTAGQVNVAWVVDDGKWQGPVALTPARYALAGTHIALAHQTAMNQLDALFVDATGAVNVMWVVEEGAWSGSVRLTGAGIAPAGAPIALSHQTSSFQIDAMFVDAEGAVCVMWAVGEGAWNGPVRLTPTQYAIPGTHVALAHQTSMNQLDALFIDASGALNVMWVVGEQKWQGPVRLTASGFAPAGAPVAAGHQSSMDQLDAFVIDNTGAVNVMWVVQEGPWQGPVRLTQTRLAVPGSAVAAGHQTSMSQLDVFFPDANQGLQVLWVIGEGAWQGPARLPGPFTM